MAYVYNSGTPSNLGTLGKVRGRHRAPFTGGLCAPSRSNSVHKRGGPIRAEGKVKLGGSSLQVSELGLGTLQWGDPTTGFGERYDEVALEEIFDTAVQGGINFFDTAEVYGYQGTKTDESSECIVGRFRKKLAASGNGALIVVGTKFFTVPWTNMLVGGGFRLGKQSVLDALQASLKRLQVDKVDLYQVHFPLPFFPDNVLAEAMAQAVQEGKVGAVGVCNYNSPEQLEKFHGLLAERGVPLACNQVKYSVLDRGPETSGLLQKAKDLGVTVVAHSPLKRGLLTTKYVESGGGAEADKIRSLLKMMGLIGTLLGGKTVTQVALNYLICKGAIPIPGAKSVEQIKDSLGAQGWRLDANELAMIDEKLASLSL